MFGKRAGIWGPFGVAKFSKRQVGFFISHCVRVNAKCQRRVGVTQLIRDPAVVSTRQAEAGRDSRAGIGKLPSTRIHAGHEQLIVEYEAGLVAPGASQSPLG